MTYVALILLDFEMKSLNMTIDAVLKIVHLVTTLPAAFELGASLGVLSSNLLVGLCFLRTWLCIGILRVSNRFAGLVVVLYVYHWCFL
jgi:hypothetical protein